MASGLGERCSFEGRSSLALHHVGYAAKAIEPAAEMYVKRFGYEVRTPVIHDPLQTALVQFLAFPGDRVYLELVSPDGPESRLTNAVRKGGGLHHLCYTAENLENAIAWLVESSMLLIMPPQSAVAFAGRRVCWLLGEDPLPIELVERNEVRDLCLPGRTRSALTAPPDMGRDACGQTVSYLT
jgi:methylmalonyl-CoA/ethylmalonyl-CoA epimerase